MTPNEAQKILDLPMQSNDADAATIRDYLKTLLTTLVSEGESFSGKRPFGNSGWEYDLYIPLVKAGLVQGSFDENDNIETLDDKAAEELIIQAIAYL